MLSPKNIQLSLSLALLSIFTFGSNELRIATAAILSWCLAGIAQHRFRTHRLATHFKRAYIVTIAVSFVLLAAFNDLFYYNVIGRLLDLFFTRDPLDPYVPGSGFVDLIETFWRRHGALIIDLYHLFWFLVKALIVMTMLPFVIAFSHWQYNEYKKDQALEIAFAYPEEPGREPPWLVSQRQPVPKPEPKRETRYMKLCDDIIFVCGKGGGFEQVVEGDYEGAVSRRRGLSRDFA